MSTLINRGIEIMWESLQSSQEGHSLLQNGTIVCSRAPYGVKASVSFPVFNRRQAKIKTDIINFDTLTALSFYFNFVSEILKNNSAMQLQYIQNNDFLITYKEKKIKVCNCYVSITNGLVFFELQLEHYSKITFFDFALFTKFLDVVIIDQERG